MYRFIAGAGLLVLALTSCGSRVPAGPVPHIVAINVATTVAPAPAAPAPAAPPQRADRAVRLASASQPVAFNADVWARLARCESGGNPRAVGGRGRFFGAFQFTLRSWHAVGMTGNPIDYPYADQLAAAQRLQAKSGWRNWPVCARRILR